ncbi:membrane-spanning 4-domains subfamily A member 6C [Anguilla anguilla]|uniref:membrane-spanning 4-domains subfamily A member 6C n=1 Tax=Anguilla anguilla TaxID=7936 RepID=UPI0015AC8367|nr:membrane-spanning 4-domains subfamily A member 6C [Anguilla anguilla]XP_035286948.1 membrane-spanning 4-domains subfamily A member 6C [Anguilla anguilla]XP_035286949.1 membrane-spanning 4-domains subfamily A member 6C [Anguilla anguilla]
MSVSVTTANGLVIVTQVFKQGEQLNIPMNSIAAPAVPAAAKPVESVEPSSPVSPMTKKFLQGQPKQLGIVQIITGLVIVALGFMLVWQNPMWGAPIWSGSVFVLSGIISAIAHRGTRPCLIKCTLALNVLSCVAAVAAIAIVTVHLITVRPGVSGCEENRESSYYSDYGRDNYYYMCQEMFWKYTIVLDGVRGLLLVLSALQLAVAVSGAVYAGRASCSSSSPKPMVVVIEKPAIGAGDHYGSDEALLGSDDAPGNPPPYDA